VESPERAEEVVQQVFLRLLQRLEQGAPVENAAAYVFRAARNLIIDEYRTRSFNEPLAAEPADTTGEDPTEPTRREIAGWMSAAVSELPEPYRRTLELTELERLSYARTAERLGLSVSGVKSRVRRGRALLRDRLLACCRFVYDARGRVIDYEPLRAPQACSSC
jgi:RNA polymerase sigma-70 factor (ECF subfamily)